MARSDGVEKPRIVTAETLKGKNDFCSSVLDTNQKHFSQTSKASNSIIGDIVSENEIAFLKVNATAYINAVSAFQHYAEPRQRARSL